MQLSLSAAILLPLLPSLPFLTLTSAYEDVSPALLLSQLLLSHIPLPQILLLKRQNGGVAAGASSLVIGGATSVLGQASSATGSRTGSATGSATSSATNSVGGSTSSALGGGSSLVETVTGSATSAAAGMATSSSKAGAAAGAMQTGQVAMMVGVLGGLGAFVGV